MPGKPSDHFYNTILTIKNPTSFPQINRVLTDAKTNYQNYPDAVKSFFHRPMAQNKELFVMVVCYSKSHIK